jgi:hypothetical protein
LPNQFSKNYRKHLLKATIFTQERVNAVLAALVLIGIALVLVGVWRYIDATQRLGSNIALDVQEDSSQFNVNTPEQAQGLIAADVEKRRLERQQNESLVVAGVGLGTLAIGWMAYDFARSRRRHKSEPNTLPAQEST